MIITFTSSKGESCSTEANITFETEAILDEYIFDPVWFDGYQFGTKVLTEEQIKDFLDTIYTINLVKT